MAKRHATARMAALTPQWAGPKQALWHRLQKSLRVRIFPAPMNATSMSSPAPAEAAGCGLSPSCRIPLAVQAILAHLARSAAAPPAPAATLLSI